MKVILKESKKSAKKFLRQKGADNDTIRLLLKTAEKMLGGGDVGKLVGWFIVRYLNFSPIGIDVGKIESEITSIERLPAIVNLFLDNLQRNKLENKNIESYKNLSEMEAANRKASGLETKREKSKRISDDFRLFWNDSDVRAGVAETHEASCKYGAGTTWCVTSKDDDSFYKDHNKTGQKVLMVLAKDKHGHNRKFGLHLTYFNISHQEDNSKNGYAELDIYDENDDNIIDTFSLEGSNNGFLYKDLLAVSFENIFDSMTISKISKATDRMIEYYSNLEAEDSNKLFEKALVVKNTVKEYNSYFKKALYPHELEYFDDLESIYVDGIVSSKKEDITKKDFEFLRALEDVDENDFNLEQKIFKELYPDETNLIKNNAEIHLTPTRHYTKRLNASFYVNINLEAENFSEHVEEICEDCIMFQKHLKKERNTKGFAYMLPVIRRLAKEMGGVEEYL